MGLHLSCPKYSFVRFDTPGNKGCCLGESDFCVPVVNLDDLRFQIIISCDTLEEANDVFALANTAAELWILNGTGNISGTAPTNIQRNYTADHAKYFKKYRTGVREVTFVWDELLFGFNTDKQFNECFEFAFNLNQTIVSDFVFISNCFIRKQASCYLSLFDYRSNEDSNGFRYCNVSNFKNRVRLPIYLGQPKFPDEETIYTKSDGVIVVTESVTKKEYQAVTDYFTEPIHEKVKDLISSDYVYIEDSRYEGTIRKNGQYEIDWDDQNDCEATAKFKALVTPFSFKNSNCSDCEPVTIPSLTPCSDDITFSTEQSTLGGTTLVTVTWSNPNGNPAEGYTWKVKNVGGTVVAGPTAFSSTDNPVLVEIPSNSGTFTIVITSICEDTATHETEIPITIP